MTEKEKIIALNEEMKSYEKTIFSFNRSDELTDFTRLDPKENGMYLTIRVGLGGIYQILNEWKDGEWMCRIADDSVTICRSRTQIKLKSLELFNEQYY